MPSYIFRLPANTAGAPVSVYAGDGGSFTSSVASGNLDGSATFTTTLPVGNYTARARSAIRDTFYTTGEELASPVDPDSLDQAALRAAFMSAVDESGQPIPGKAGRVVFNAAGEPLNIEMVAV